MTLDDFFEILAKLIIQCGVGPTRLRQRNALVDGTATELRRSNHSDGLRVAFHNDFGSPPDPFHDCREVPRYLSLAHVHFSHPFDHTAPSNIIWS